MSDTVEDKTLAYIKELAIQIQKDPSARGRIIKALSGNPNKDIARLLSIRQHNMPYYKEQFANEIKPVLDRMMLSKKAQEFKYATFPRLSKHSLYLKLYQAFLWLIDHDDPDGKYITLRQDIEIFKATEGVRMRFINRDKTLLNNATEIEDEAAKPKPNWQLKIDDFIANSKQGEKLIIDRNLALTDEEVNDVRVQLTGLEGILSKVESGRILLVKPKPEDLEALKGVKE